MIDLDADVSKDGQGVLGEDDEGEKGRDLEHISTLLDPMSQEERIGGDRILRAHVHPLPKEKRKMVLLLMGIRVGLDYWWCDWIRAASLGVDSQPREDMVGLSCLLLSLLTRCADSIQC